MGNQKNESTITCHSTRGRDARKQTDESGQHYIGILDGFLQDSRCREAQEKHGWTEGKCKEMDETAQRNHIHQLTKAELDRYRSNCNLQLNDPGDNGLMASRSDCRAAVDRNS